VAVNTKPFEFVRNTRASRGGMSEYRSAKALPRWPIASCAIAWRTPGRTHTGPGRKNRTCPGTPPVESKAVVMRPAILREPRGKRRDGVEKGIRVDAQQLLPRTGASRDQDDAAPGRPREIGIDLHVPDGDGFVRRHGRLRHQPAQH